MHISLYHILYSFGIFYFKNDCFIVVELKPMLNDLKSPEQGRRHLLLTSTYNNKQSTVLSPFNTGQQCVPYTVTDRYIRCGKQTRGLGYFHMHERSRYVLSQYK